MIHPQQQYTNETLMMAQQVANRCGWDDVAKVIATGLAMGQSVQLEMRASINAGDISPPAQPQTPWWPPSGAGEG